MPLRIDGAAPPNLFAGILIECGDELLLLVVVDDDHEAAKSLLIGQSPVGGAVFSAIDILSRLK